MIIDTGFRVKEHIIGERAKAIYKVLLSTRSSVGFKLELFQTDDSISPYIICSTSTVNGNKDWCGFNQFDDALYYYLNVDIDLDKHIAKYLISKAVKND